MSKGNQHRMIPIRDGKGKQLWWVCRKAECGYADYGSGTQYSKICPKLTGPFKKPGMGREREG